MHDYQLYALVASWAVALVLWLNIIRKNQRDKELGEPELSEYANAYMVGNHIHEKMEMPNPSKIMMRDPIFEAVWQAIKSWDINAPEFYNGYSNATGSHVLVILQAIDRALKDKELIRTRTEDYVFPLGKFDDLVARETNQFRRHFVAQSYSDVRKLVCELVYAGVNWRYETDRANPFAFSVATCLRTLEQIQVSTEDLKKAGIPNTFEEGIQFAHEQIFNIKIGQSE